MKKIGLFFAVLLCNVIAVSQTPNWDWVNAIHGPSNEDEIDAVASDYMGNVFISGKFEDSLQVTGSTTWQNSNGMADIMLVKYDSSGAFQWKKQFGGTGEDNVFDADCTPAGEVVLSGYFQNTIQFGTYTLTSMGGFDAFLVKLDGQGNVLWAKQFGGTSDDGGNELAINENGQIALIAMSIGDFTYDSFTYLNPNHGIRDAFIIAVNPDGSAQWVRTVSGVGGCRTKSVDIDSVGNIYAGGDFISVNYIVDEMGTHHNLSSNGGKDAFVTCWDKNGNLQWFKNWGGSGDDLCKGIAVTKNQDVYLAGPFYNDVDFESITLSAGTTQDFFIWKLNSSGSTLWLRQISASTDVLEGGEVQTDGKGGVLMGVGLNSTVSMQNDVGSVNFNLIASGKTNPFFFEYDKNGKIVFTKFADNNSNGNGSFGEIARSGSRVFLDVIIYGELTFNTVVSTGSTTNKDAALVSLTLPEATSDIQQWAPDQFKVFPNPVLTDVQILVPHTQFDIYIYNALGEQMITQRNNLNACTIDCSKLYSGIYIVQIVSKHGVNQVKILKQ